MPPLKLEVFKTGETRPETAEAAAASDLEEARLASYEQGYTAGWEDAISAQSEDQSRLRTDLARNLQAMSFTYHEARSHVLRAMAPLMQEVATRLLPGIAREALAPVVLDALMPLVEERADTPIVLVLNPVARPAVERLLETAAGLPVTLREEPSLGEGQVYLQLGESELHVDLDRASTEIIGALRAVFDPIEQERKHG